MKAPSDSPDGLDELLESCWQASPDQRPNFSQILTKIEDIVQKIMQSARNSVLVNTSTVAPVAPKTNNLYYNNSIYQ